MLSQTKNPEIISTTFVFYGNNPWDSPDNVKYADNFIASCVFTNNNISFGIICADFGFTIPENSEIKSVDINILCNKSGVSVRHEFIRLYINGTISANINTLTRQYPTTKTMHTFTYQNSTLLTPTMVNQNSPSFFGVGIAAGGYSGTAYIDQITMTVNYELKNELSVKVNDEWKDFDSSYIKVNGVWKTIDRILINDNDVWK